MQRSDMQVKMERKKTPNKAFAADRKKPRPLKSNVMNP